MKKPWVVDLGASYVINKSELSVRLAYYSAIAAYDLIHRDELTSNSIFDASIDFGVPRMANKSVLNFGVGFIQNLSEKTSLYLGFNTDFNNLDQTQFDQAPDELQSLDFVPTIGTSDLFNYSIGLSHKLKSYQLIYGISYMRGRSNNDRQIVNLSDPVDDLLLFGQRTNTANTSIDGLSLHVGFVYYY